MIGALSGGQLLELIWVGLAASIVVAVTFALGIHGAARAAEHSRAGRSAAAGAYGALALLGLLAFAAAVALGLATIVTK
jgi:hypothetical protein